MPKNIAMKAAAPFAVEFTYQEFVDAVRATGLPMKNGKPEVDHKINLGSVSDVAVPGETGEQVLIVEWVKEV